MRGSRSIEKACSVAHVKRLFIVGGSASRLSANGSELYDLNHYPAPYDAGVRGAKNYLHEIRENTDLDWAYLSRPPNHGPMGPQGRRGTYRVGVDHPVTDATGKSEISKEDLAIALVNELEKPRIHKTRFTIGY
jgi:uncharacterized protein